MKNLFMFLILLSLCIGNTIGISTLLVKNELHNKVLGVRCRSKDDHLGDHILQVGQMTKNNFDDNIWRRTLFWCNMWKGPDFKIHISFDAYKSMWKADYGPTYLWIAREDGIYYTQTDKPPVKR
ncbi:putative S-protein1 [Cardamine amara subsp. amara]|uniref:S-protein homolog n=1 Tax=Cardamine amara subsp. amara TaxID=228776 RepID=A0ABD1ARJ5_CARAN